MSDRLLPHNLLKMTIPHLFPPFCSVVIAASAAAPAVVGITTPPPYSAAGSGFIVHPSGKPLHSTTSASIISIIISFIMIIDIFLRVYIS
jgi:hypothetical protein